MHRFFIHRRRLVAPAIPNIGSDIGNLLSEIAVQLVEAEPSAFLFEDAKKGSDGKREAAPSEGEMMGRYLRAMSFLRAPRPAPEAVSEELTVNQTNVTTVAAVG